MSEKKSKLLRRQDRARGIVKERPRPGGHQSGVYAKPRQNVPKMKSRRTAK